MSVTIAVEGQSDVPVLRRILSYVGLQVGVIQGRGGKSVIDRNLNGYNEAARTCPWVVVRDLDHDAPCAPTLVTQLLPAPSNGMRFRIAVREIESWILADPGAVSKFLRVKRNLVPALPDTLDDPKEVLLTLAQRSPNHLIRADMVRTVGLSVFEGPAYVSRISELATDYWSPHVAQTRSDSLKRSIARLRTLRGFGQ